jgi:hypothetical protein
MLEITGKKAERHPEQKEASPLSRTLMKRKMAEIVDTPGMDRPRFGSDSVRPARWGLNYMHNDLPDAKG